MSETSPFRSMADRDAIDAEMVWEARDVPVTLHAALARARDRFGDRPAISYQILSKPGSKSETLTWRALYDRSCQAANLFRAHGIGESDVVAYVLPNATETVVTLLAGSIAGIVLPINPLLEAEQIAAILRDTGAKVVVTLRPFPKTDVAEKVARAVMQAPEVKTVFEIDLLRHLPPPKSWIVPFLRPKHDVHHHAEVLDFTASVDAQPKTLSFPDSAGDRVAAYFCTGGTTGLPKVAQHKYSGMIYNGWIGSRLLFSETDTIMCPMPLFHVFACYPVLASAIRSGAHAVFPTPQGYRGEGVFENFWKLVAHWNATFMISVPTAFSVLMQRPVDADISSLKLAFSGSAPLPLELYNRFEKATGVEIIEGYGLTEATCLVACNPVGGIKKIGSVGIPFPHTKVRILLHGEDGVEECETDEVGEICIDNPGVFEGSTYTEASRNADLFHHDIYLRTGDLGRIDEEGYLWITGRMKDLIIRGGHNIDPADIEEALMGHDAVAMAGAVGQPDAHAGELPCAFVELVDGASVTAEELMAFAKTRVHERAAQPKHIDILDQLPKTAVGKVFKPDLRKKAILRVLNADLAASGLGAEVVEVVEDTRRGLVAQLHCKTDADRDAVAQTMGRYALAWDWRA